MKRRPSNSRLQGTGTRGGVRGVGARAAPSGAFLVIRPATHGRLHIQKLKKIGPHAGNLKRSHNLYRERDTTHTQTFFELKKLI